MGRYKNNLNLDKEELVQLIVCDLLNGESQYRVMLKLKRDQYEGFTTSKLSKTSRYNYLNEAYEQCKDPILENRQRMREMAYAQLNDVYAECREHGDRQNAIAARKELNKLAGLYEADKIDIKADVNVDISFGLEDETELQD